MTTRIDSIRIYDDTPERRVDAVFVVHGDEGEGDMTIHISRTGVFRIEVNDETAEDRRQP